LSVVVDSNLFVAVETKARQGSAIRAQLRDWRQNGEDLHAPWLFRFEVASALTRLGASHSISAEEAGATWASIEALGQRIVFHDIEDGPRVMESP
jgi:hypothetical protein